MSYFVEYNDTGVEPRKRRVCRYYQRGVCRFGNRCRNFHGDEESTYLREQTNSMNTQTTKHTQQDLEEDSTIFPAKLKNIKNEFGPSTSITEAIQKSQSLKKTCGICLDIILEKTAKKEQLFGILPNCNHCFCFTCINTWRQSKDFDFNVSKACPECRTASNYVYPSQVWFEDKNEKEKYISREKLKMQTIDCRYFEKGKGKCPFGNTCLYLHALPSGKIMDVGPPKPRRPRVSNFEQELDVETLSWLNDDDDDDSDFDLYLRDATLALQAYDENNFRRILALERILNLNYSSSDAESDD